MQPWILNELAHAGPEHLDPEFVGTYERKAGVDQVDDVAVLRRHGLDHTSTLVDMGCGTGRLALAAAPYVGRVIAVDVSPTMLDFLRHQIGQAGLTNVECVQAGFLTFEHSGPPVDAVYTRNALHHLPDFWKVRALDRVARMLKAGGVLRLRDLIFDFQPGETDAVIAEWFDGAAIDPELGYTRHDLAEHVRTEYSTFSWLLAPMLTATGFDIVETNFERRTYAEYTCIKR